MLGEGVSGAEAKEIEKRLSTGRPWGSEGFVERLAKRLGRSLTPLKRGWPKGRKRQGRRGTMGP